jgi:SH3-like domain-containing protein
LISRLVHLSVIATLALGAQAAYADLDYVTTGRPAILYDGPSSTSSKIAVVSAGYPLEVVVRSGNWLKVRDDTGQLLWIESASAQGKPGVMIITDQATILEKPQSDAPVNYKVTKGVLLELLGNASEPGWLKVRHPQGGEGYLPLQDVWGQ